MGKKTKISKEDSAEDYCFHCKDGGLLRICDYKDCVKAYHPQCVEKDDSFLKSEVPWSCKWHFCFICKNASKFCCFCCSKAVCRRCLYGAEFAVIRGHRGFCNHCLTLIGLIEGIKNPDPDEGKIDFNDQQTYEFMFKYYWEMTKKSEGLTSKHIIRGDKFLNRSRNSGYLSNSNDVFEGGDDIEFEDKNQFISDVDDLNYINRHEAMNKWKRNKGKESAMERKVKSKKEEFNGWGSKLLFDFLNSIGKETTQELSQHDVTAIITRYCNEHQLFDPVKKKKVICDERLRSLLGRKSANKNSIYNLLTSHFVQNFEQSRDECGYSSEDMFENISICKRQRNSSTDGKCQNKEEIPDMQQGYFASIIAENIKLLYLKRSLVEELSKQPETFDAKVIGSFVRIKSDPYDYSQKNSHQLLKVTGIKRISRNGEVNTDIVLQVSNMPKDIPICKLSDDNFSEEECEDLRQRVKDGQLDRPNVVEFKEKARSLHEVITKHWIMKELARLQNLCNQANEKGWRKELAEYMERLSLLQTPSEQSRLLDEIPKIIVDETEIEPANKDLCRKVELENNISPESDLRQLPKPSRKSSGGNGISSCLKNEAGFSGQLQGQSSAVLPEKQHQPTNVTFVEMEDRPVEIEHEKVKNKQSVPTVEVIELSDDEEQDTSIAASKKTSNNLKSSLWHIRSPYGVKNGPYSMAILKEWSESYHSDELQFQVWKISQSPEEAIPLIDAIRLAFPGM